ncbi:hypothetical protein DVK85_12540 [Flavobacterium arcticum]|uniref:DUF6265 domain-containing protein n=1 Tax=Flavobacterium arcticum TaxID=1784713 RepID=A0A345HEK4_9FLAO|nr:DUF6265 family protein [Flavobacterium arcticum]AXG75014.1 hypothetical protein DVK85_12540 [Flavobacterium arcticum]KAF2506567.1 hypothetical protein E0W72_13115 [Flavobacterium arcticum]
MKTKILLCAAILCSTIACKNKKEDASAKTYKQIKKVSWLIGNWGATSNQGTLIENWQKTNDSVYNGQSFFIIENDTVFAEHIALEEVNGKLTYIVNVSGQNNNKPVRFEMTSITNNQIIFENPEHDFPTKIIYNNVTNDSLVAEISGIKNGKPNSQKFTMARQ